MYEHPENFDFETSSDYDLPYTLVVCFKLLFNFYVCTLEVKTVDIGNQNG